MWLINSSIGRKVVMSVTGIALILFLTFHCAMNLVALFSEEGYNMICEFLAVRLVVTTVTRWLHRSIPASWSGLRRTCSYSV